jgi:hypothetical protein
MPEKKESFIQIVTPEAIEKNIYVIRNQKVMLSIDLADLYDVEVRALVQAAKRNIKRFPSDFMFQLSDKEFSDLKSQIVISSWGGARRSRPYAFTDNGVAMLSSVLRSERAIAVNVEIMRAFTRLRKQASIHKDLILRIDQIEEKYDSQFKIVFDAIRQLVIPPDKPKRPIGFRKD